MLGSISFGYGPGNRPENVKELHTSLVNQWISLNHASPEKKVSLGKISLESAKQKFYDDCHLFSERAWIRNVEIIPKGGSLEGEEGYIFYSVSLWTESSKWISEYRFKIKQSGVEYLD